MSFDIVVVLFIHGEDIHIVPPFVPGLSTFCGNHVSGNQHYGLFANPTMKGDAALLVLLGVCSSCFPLKPSKEGLSGNTT